MTQKVPTGRIKTKVKVTAVKIHGPNSPDVIEGRVPLDHRESVQMDQPEQIIELTEAQVRETFGDEIADLWFGREDE
jgi:hypothetical protein